MPGKRDFQIFPARFNLNWYSLKKLKTPALSPARYRNVTGRFDPGAE